MKPETLLKFMPDDPLYWVTEALRKNPNTKFRVDVFGEYPFDELGWADDPSSYFPTEETRYVGVIWRSAKGQNTGFYEVYSNTSKEALIEKLETLRSIHTQWTGNSCKILPIQEIQI